FRTPHSAFRISNAGVAQQRQQQFRKLPGDPPHESASLSVGPILCSRSSNYQSGRLRSARLKVRFLPRVPISMTKPECRMPKEIQNPKPEELHAGKHWIVKFRDSFGSHDSSFVIFLGVWFAPNSRGAGLRN